MPTRHIDAEQNVTVLHYLQTLKTQLNKRGVIFERDGKNSALLDRCILHIRRLQLVEDLFVTGHSETVKITCDMCDKKDSCDLAYDAYNTNGDCLAAK